MQRKHSLMQFINLSPDGRAPTSQNSRRKSITCFWIQDKRSSNIKCLKCLSLLTFVLRNLAKFIEKGYFSLKRIMHLIYYRFLKTRNRSVESLSYRLQRNLVMKVSTLQLMELSILNWVLSVSASMNLSIIL